MGHEAEGQWGGRGTVMFSFSTLQASAAPPRHVRGCVLCPSCRKKDSHRRRRGRCRALSLLRDLLESHSQLQVRGARRCPLRRDLLTADTLPCH